MKAIEANELRLGNYVQYDTELIVKVDIGLMRVIILNHVNIYPIGLTPEILEKCGFQKIDLYEDEFYMQFDHDDIDIYTGDKNGICEVVFSIQDNEIKRVQFFHELQNLYFSLTNTELTITL